ncbi:MAG: hypothetical protein KDM91_10690 [Verrucomicrobiae bacterium]|nr:hypothetical protein [Verrucomicrobiae bacterium]MCP5540230.1 hypothetical protein [Akkermansiaceae bacterium]MCP5551165.1 hypothetical protein [Akkermansiaceae bacterium]
MDELHLYSEDELKELQSHLNLALRFRGAHSVRGDGDRATSVGLAAVEPGDDGAAEDCQKMLMDLETDMSLSEQALLAGVVLADLYQSKVFSSRRVNDVIEECGRPKIAHITSAINSLLEKNYLSGGTKELRLTTGGRVRVDALLRQWAESRSAA